jgi:hypothetical protein
LRASSEGEVGQDQVALVAELGEERGLDGRAGAFPRIGLRIGSRIGPWIGLRVGLRRAFTFQALKRGLGLGGNLLAFALRAGVPGLPVEAEELMEQKGAFKSQWDKREIGQCVHLGTSLNLEHHGSKRHFSC